MYISCTNIPLFFTCSISFIMSKSNINLRSILEANKLTGPNYIDWLRNLKRVLRSEKLDYVMEKAVPPPLAGNVSTAGHEAYLKYAEDMDVVCGIMLVSTSPGLQKQHEHIDAPTILLYLQELFEKQNRTERYEISKALFRCRNVEGTSDMQYDMKMNGYIESLATWDSRWMLN